MKYYKEMELVNAIPNPDSKKKMTTLTLILNETKQINKRKQTCHSK